MKTQKGDDDNRESLPLDMIIEILTKLPAKFLFKFRCVSKQWCSIIRSRSFIDSFMSLSLSRPRILLCVSILRGDKRQLLFLSSPLHLQDSNHSSIVYKHDMPELISYCNSVRGIICLSLGDCGFMICNPTTRQVITLPNDSLTELESKPCICFMCLGYDTSNDQYKILRTVRRAPFGSAEHSVCTLRGGGGGRSSFSSWRRVECSFHYFHRTNPLCINGVVYYGAIAYGPTRYPIVSFDVGSERLLLMEGPPKEEELVHLIDYQGKVACFCVTIDKSYSLWILDDVKKQLWSKTCVFSPSFCDSYRNFNLRIFGTTDAGEIIFVSTLTAEGDFELFYWDLKKNNVSRRARIGGITEYEELMCTRNNSVFSMPSSCDHVENIISF
ncbi:hypothetical protein EUTSA_v10000468mg [Eutrema salsugineum]|uniref:F-box domain-containing protein n=1 Tax=Eutrema salsugineum TaxID=72664 RepID=V4LRT1_EUTSA|nr:hypothetical protein EUTSA_v10000468mg [Eutrema salsugineum]